MGKVHHAIAALSAAILFATPFLSPAAAKLWTGAISTDWFEPNNWDPAGVPAPEDTAFVKTNNIVYLGSDVVLHGLNLDGSSTTLDGPGHLTVTNFNWTNGVLQGSGTCTIPAGGTLRLEPSGRKDLHRNLLNFGTVVHADYLFMTATFHNAGTFDMRGDANLGGANAPPPSPWYQGLFKNAGLFSKSTGLKTNTINIPFENRGEMRLLSGTLRLLHYHTNEGSVHISDGATLALLACPVIAPSCSLQGFGTLRFGDSSPPFGSIGTTTVLTTNPIHPRVEILNHPRDSWIVGSPTLNFDAAVSVRECVLDGGGIAGTNTVTITNLLWSKGALGGRGTIRIPAGGSAMIAGVGMKLAQLQTMINEGEILCLDSVEGRGSFYERFLLINRGVFHAMGVTNLTAGNFVNEGTFIYSGGAAACKMLHFTNSGRFELRTGTVTFDQYRQLDGELLLSGGNIDTQSEWIDIRGGALRGFGTIAADFYWYPAVASNGEIDPVGLLTIDGGFYHSANARLQIDIGGLIPGTEFDQVHVSGIANLSGILNVRLVNGFRPKAGDRFEILRRRHHLGYASSFSQVNGLALSEGLSLVPQYTETNLVLVATDFSTPPFQIALSLADHRAFRVQFRGAVPSNYVLQGTTTLTNWVDLFVNQGPIELIDHIDRDAPFFPYRFYRVRWGE